MSIEATKVAKEAYKNAIKKVNDEFENSTVVGYEVPGKKPIFKVFPDVQKVKTMMEIGKAEFAYVGKIRLQKTENGLEPTLEEVDMSKVKIGGFRLSEKDKKMFEERRKEREQNLQKLKSYSSQIPDEIKSMISGINNETNYALMACLLKEGEQSYAQLKEKLGLDDRALRKSIVEMENSALVNEKGPIYSVKDKKTNNTIGITPPPDKSVVEATNLGKSFMKNLYKIYELPPRRKNKP